MTTLRAVTVCVDYDDILRLTLPRTTREVDQLTVVTSYEDTKTFRYCCGLDNVSVFRTDAFYRGGARFNKGLALEEAFDFMGREGWMLVLDADIYLPEGLKGRLPHLMVGRLYSPFRRILADPRKLPTLKDWNSLPRRVDLGLYGYFQLFNASDPALVRRPWYGVNWTHAGGCDKEFQERWAHHNKIRPPFDVLHLGLPDENWFGRSSARLDGIPVPEATARKELQEKLKRKHGWSRRRTNEVLNEKVGGVPPTANTVEGAQ